MSTSSSPLDPDTYDGMLRTLQYRTQDIAEKAGQSHVQRPQDFAADPFHGYPPPFPDAKDDPERVYFTMIDNPHPPCTLSIDELEPITLSELVMDSHHCGKFLLVRFERDTGCKRLSASACVTDQTPDNHKDAKSYFRAGQASYALGKSDAAATYSRKLLDLPGDHPDAAKLLSRSEARLYEQTSGIYDISAIKNSISGRKPRVDVADFLSNTAVKFSVHSRGRGLFATRNLEAGDLILAETAFASVWDREKTKVMAMKWDARLPKLFSEQEVGLWKVVLQQVRNNPVAGRSLLELHGDHNVLGSDVVEVDGMHVVDAYQVHDIVARNTLQLGGIPGSKRRGSGIYIRSSYVNHSVDPNAERIIIGDLVLIYATKAILNGEDICLGDGEELSPPLEVAVRSSSDGAGAVIPSSNATLVTGGSP